MSIKTKLKNFLIIGYGKTGSHLYNAIRNSSGSSRVSAIKNTGSGNIKNAVSRADIIFICTQDDKIGKAVKMISDTGAKLNGKIISHTSGALNSDELVLLKKKGADTASFHPVQTFMQKAKKKDRLFENIYIAVEGNKASRKELFNIAKKIKSTPFEIKKELKILHHLCCVISSNYLVTNLSFLRGIYTQKFGFKKDNFFSIYMPLIEQTLRNVKEKGTEYSLTGPVARKDLKTIAKHIEALNNFRLYEITEYYKFMALKTTRIAELKGALNKKDLQKLNKILGVKN